MNYQRAGLLLVISAPSGTGKSTLIRELCTEFPRLAFSVSYTTRTARPGEEHGKDYIFISPEAFSSLRSQNALAEWAEVHGHCYGTPRMAVVEMLDQGRDVLFDIDVQGARQLREAFPDGTFVFLLPPSRTALEARLKKRGTESSNIIAKRLGNARKEIEQAQFFDFLVVNDDLDQAYQQLRSIYLADGLRTRRNSDMISSILSTWGENG